MIGSTFVYSPDPERLDGIVADLDAIDDFEHVNMAELITLDFELVCRSANLPWGAKKPLIFDEEAGLAIFKVDSQGLKHVVENKQAFTPSQSSDLEVLEIFTSKCGSDHIYEIASF